MNTQTHEKLIQRKLSMLDLADQLQNVSEACKIMRVSRDTFYRVKNAYLEGGVGSLLEQSRKGKPILKNRVVREVEEAVLKLSFEFPTYGQKRISQELRRQNIWISDGGVRSVWLRHNLEVKEKRLKWLEEKVRQEGIQLTPEQVESLSRLKEEKQTDDEIETQHPGYLLSQDTYYVGNMKGVGRIYLQVVIDTHCRVSFGKLYTSKLPVTSADVLNDKVLPFFEEHKVPVHRILTDRGTEYCGRIDTHDYELFLALNDIEHTQTKARSPQTNGICERLNKTLSEEFFSVTFRSKLYNTVEDLQKDLDEYLIFYNTKRPHQGKRCDGKTPMQTFEEAKPLVFQKTIPTGQDVPACEVKLN